MSDRSPRPPAALRQHSAALGSIRDLVQGAGGNTSFKVENTLWIKASGTHLCDADSQKIFMPIDLALARECIARDLEDLSTAVSSEGNGLRPSIESSFHALMQQKAVVHTHPLDVIALAVRTDAERVLTDRLTDFDWLWIPYARPGMPITREIAARGAKKQYDVIVLGNHGLITAHDEIEEAFRLTNAVAAACRSRAPRPRPSVYNVRPTQHLEAASKRVGMAIASAAHVHSLAFDSFSCAFVKAGHVLFPDQAVFLGPSIAFATGPEFCEDVISDYIDTWAAPPKVLVIEEQGVLVERNNPEQIEELLSGFADIVLRLDRNVPITSLSSENIDELLNWSAERYRRSINATSSQFRS